MKNDKPTVLLVGITGTLGYKIATAILNKGAMNIRALVRKGNRQPSCWKQFMAQGITLVEGDLLYISSLLKACEGVDIVVSAVRGGQDESSEKEIVLYGQLNLIEAAKISGVKRFIPSDFSFDYFKLALGDNYNLDLRRQVAVELINSGMDYTFLMNGVFTEVLLSPFLQVFDFHSGTFSYWGDGDTLFDTTTTDDVAKYVAEAIADPALVKRSLKVAGDVLTMKQLAMNYEIVTGKRLIEKHLGSVEDLHTLIQQKQAKASSHLEYLPEQYLYTMVSGKGKLDGLQSARYRHIQPKSIRQFLCERYSYIYPISLRNFLCKVSI